MDCREGFRMGGACAETIHALWSFRLFGRRQNQNYLKKFFGLRLLLLLLPRVRASVPVDPSVVAAVGTAVDAGTLGIAERRYLGSETRSGAAPFAKNAFGHGGNLPRRSYAKTWIRLA